MVANKVPLYEEMAEVIRKAGTPLSIDALASRVQFRTKKGTPPSTYQITSNAFYRPDLFEVLIRLKK